MIRSRANQQELKWFSMWIRESGELKTKVNYPFIYFFLEPNVVLVYKIETQKYLTVSEIWEYGEWQTYELNLAEEFDTFKHEESKSLEGRGYLVKQDVTNIMLDIINKQIQKHRMYPTPAPVHIVITESAAGSLKYGLERPKVVIGFPDFLSIGPVWKLDEKIGQKFRFEWLYEHINTEQDDYEYENKFTNTLLEIEDILEQAPIYLWTANNASEQTGVRFILQLLQGKENDVFLINSTDFYDQYIAAKDQGQSFTHTNQIEAEHLRLVFEKNKVAKPLSNEDKLRFQKEWQELSQTKEVLRLWVNNKIESAPEHHYDPLIINTIEILHKEQINKDFIKTGRVIGETLGRMKELISDSFLEYRIRHLVYSGVLEMKGIPKSMRHYSVKLRT